MTAKGKMTQAQAVAWIAERTGYGKKEVKDVLEGTLDLLQLQLGKGGPGEQLIPILNIKVLVKKTPAKKARRAWNPFTQQMQDYPAKKAGKKVVVRAMKKLKDCVS